MLRAFLISPDEEWEAANASDIDAGHSCSMPGLKCPACSAWAMTGIQYPTVECEALQGRVGKRLEPWPVDPQTFSLLAQMISPLLASGQALSPGTKFGPLRGTASGQIGDFGWLNPWTMLLREATLKAMQEAGLGLTAVPADLCFREKLHEDLYQIEAIPRVKISGSSYRQPTPCAVCGRAGHRWPGDIELDGSSLDSTISVQRLFEFPTRMIVNDRMAMLIRENKLTNAVLEEVAIA
jgi:uncharacterized double-CXXCG motif protein